MTRDELKKLEPGDLVRAKFNGEVYMVTGNYGERVTAVQTVDITNPPEWEVVSLPKGLRG